MHPEAGSDRQAHHALRVALAPPLAFWIAWTLALPLPFVAAVICASLALAFAARPPAAAWIAVLGLTWLVPPVFVALADGLHAFPYLLVAAIGAILFAALRLQARAATRPLGALIAVFAILMPVMTDRAVFLGEVVALSLALTTSVAVAVLAAGFLIFPDAGPDAGAGPGADMDGAGATRWAAGGAVVLVPVLALILFLDAPDAIRVLLVSATLVAAPGAGALAVVLRNAVLSVGIAGVGVCAVAVLYAIWPSVPAALAALALVSLTMARKAVADPGRSTRAAAMPIVWVIASLGADAPIDQTVTMAVHAAIAGLYVLIGLDLVTRWRPLARPV